MSKETPDRSASDSPEEEILSDALRDLMRAGLVERDAIMAEPELPLPPIGPLLEKWKRMHPVSTAAGAVTADDELRLAAREGVSISPETRARIAEMMKAMQKKPQSDGTQSR